MAEASVQVLNNVQTTIAHARHTQIVSIVGKEYILFQKGKKGKTVEISREGITH